MKVSTILGFVVLVLLGMTGCVRRSDFNAKVGELNKCQAGLQAYGAAVAKMQTDLQRTSADAKDTKTELSARTSRANKDLGDFQKQLDDATALASSLRTELQRTGADVDKLLKEKGALSTSLDQTKSRLDELRKAQAAAEQRAEVLRDLVSRFQKMADAGQLKVMIRRGRMVVVLPNDILFDSGRADIKTAGHATLKSVADILRGIPNRQFQIAGHTDNQPIQTSAYASNWYLSTARAVKVLDFVIKSGMNPSTLSASGYGEFDPVADNRTPENRAKNRRIEIVIQPNVDELLATGLPQGK